MKVLSSMSLLEDLAGQYVLRPGQNPSLAGHRPVVQAGTLARLLRGQSGAGLVRILGSLFTLCSHAHQRAAALVWNAACPLADPLPIAPRVLLRLETARDHLRSMALDWPRRLALDAQQAQGLRCLVASPLMSPSTTGMTTEQAGLWLGQLRGWLNGFEQANADTVATVGMASPLLVLQDWHALAQGLSPALNRLDLLHPDAQEQALRLRELAQAMLADLAFVQHPTWRGECAETGAWTRLRHRQHKPSPSLSAWSRLSARWNEVQEIARADPLPQDAPQDPLLSCGALALGEGSALAWCEMARGLLLHWVRVDACGIVVDYRVLAPTEWNFHPQGALARALAEVPSDDVRSARCLAAAFDACVDCRIESAAP